MKYSLGNKIRELRLHKQLTQEQLAQLCKVSSAAISKWEHDLSYPDITLLPILARIFHVSTDELLNFESEPSEEEIVEMAKKALEMYQSVPFEEAFAYTKELLYTYPNSELLKLRIVSNTMYVMMFGGEKNGAVYQTFAKELCEELINSTSDPIKEGAVIFLVDFYMMEEKYDKAEQLLESFPKHFDPISMLPSIYLMQKDYVKANKLLQEQLYQHYHAICMNIMSLATIARNTHKKEEIKAYLDLLKALQTIFHMEEDISFMPITEGYYEDKQEALYYVKRYVDMLLHWDEIAKRKEALLKQTLWFQKIALDKNSLPTIMRKEQLLQLLDDKDLDYLREEEEFQALYKKIQNS